MLTFILAERVSQKSVYDPLVLVPLGLWWSWQNHITTEAAAHLLVTGAEREEVGNQGSLKVVLKYVLLRNHWPQPRHLLRLSLQHNRLWDTIKSS